MVFENPGMENTSHTLNIALERALQADIPLVVSTSSGATAVLLTEMARGRGFAQDIVAVTHAHGSDPEAPDKQELTPENRALLLQHDVHIVTAAHVLSGAERGLSTKFGGVYPVEIIAHTLRMFGQGTKVAVEIASMALDAGCLHYGQSVVAIGGTGRGADTAACLIPAHARDILSTHIQEILCKPA